VSRAGSSCAWSSGAVSGVLLCGEIEDRTEEMDCPYSVYLEAPLADRRVVDIARGDAELDLFVPDW
jgi:hypothetical protein